VENGSSHASTSLLLACISKIEKMRMTAGQIKVPSPGRQIAFHQLLVAARKNWLVDALKEALGVADPNIVKEQISKFVPADVQKILAANGVRDELVFPVPAVLEAKADARRILPPASWRATERILQGWNRDGAIQEHGDRRAIEFDKASRP
jgi:hypothetical protein